jgi:hypothetical protein
MSDDEDPPQGIGQRMTVRDDDEHSTHKRRKRLIEDLREQAISVRAEAHSRQIHGQLSRQAARREYRGAVSVYLREVFQVLAAEEVALSKDYEQGIGLGEVVFEPPEELVSFARDNVRKLLPGEQVPTAEVASINGLRSVTELPSPLSYTFTVDYRAGGQTDTKSRTVTAELPQRVLDKAIEEADKALSEVGVGLEIDEGEQRTKIDRDLLEEVDEWRRNNL